MGAIAPNFLRTLGLAAVAGSIVPALAAPPPVASTLVTPQNYARAETGRSFYNI